MDNENMILITHDGPSRYVLNLPDHIRSDKRQYVFPEYTRGSKRDRTHYISEDAYYYLKDETSAFKSGRLRVVVKEAPQQIKEHQKEINEEVKDTTPEYEDNALTREEIEKILKGTKANIYKRLSTIESSSQKTFVVETIKEIGFNNLDKLREVVRALYGEEMELDYIFPPEN